MAYQKTKEAITVYFHRDRNHWMGHITLMMEGPKVYTPAGATVSLDVNGKSLDWFSPGCRETCAESFSYCWRIQTLPDELC